MRVKMNMTEVLLGERSYRVQEILCHSRKVLQITVRGQADFSRDCVGIVNRRAVGFDEGVEGLVGGVLISCMRLIELIWLQRVWFEQGKWMLQLGFLRLDNPVKRIITFSGTRQQFLVV